MLKRILFWSVWPGLFVYFRFSRRARVLLMDGEYMLLVKDRFLLWFGQDQWALPGGGLHRFEQPVVGAVRELREELGIHLDESQLTVLKQNRIGSYGLRYYAYFLSAQVSRMTPLQLQNTEIATAEWHSIKELDTQLLKPEVLEALQLIRAGSELPQMRG